MNKLRYKYNKPGVCSHSLCCLHYVWSSPCLTTRIFGRILNTHSYCLLPCCYHLLAWAHTSSSVCVCVLGGAGFLAGPLLFTLYPGLSVSNPPPVNSRTPLSNVCHSRSLSVFCRSLTDVQVRAGEWHAIALRVGGIMQRVTGLQVKCLAVVCCCCWCKNHSGLLGLPGVLRESHCLLVSGLTTFEGRRRCS